MQISCAKESCVLFGARNFYARKKLAQESTTHAQKKVHVSVGLISFWYKILCRDVYVSFTRISPTEL